MAPSKPFSKDPRAEALDAETEKAFQRSMRRNDKLLKELAKR